VFAISDDGGVLELLWPLVYTLALSSVQTNLIILMLSPSFLRLAGKSMVVVAGLTYGLRRGLRHGEYAGPAEDHGLPFAPATSVADDQFGAVLTRLSQLEKTLEMQRDSGLKMNSEFVSRAELAEAIDRTTSGVLRQVDQRFEVQRLSIQTLQLLVEQTDRMLGRVLVHLENRASAFGEEDAELSDFDESLLSNSAH